MLAAKFDQAARTGKRLRGVTADTRNIEFDVHLWSLERMHLAQLSAAGDIDGAIAVLREDLSNPRAHDQLLCFLEQHGRYREAAEQAERANQLYPDDWQLQAGLLRHYAREGMTRETLALRRRQFEHRPSVENYQEVLKAGRAAGENIAALRFALLDHLQRQEAMPRRPTHPMAAWPGGPFARPAAAQSATYAPDVTLRAAILCSEKLGRSLRPRAAAVGVRRKSAGRHRHPPAGRSEPTGGGAVAARVRRRHAAFQQPVQRGAGAGAADRRAHGCGRAGGLVGAAAHRVQGQAEFHAGSAGAVRLCIGCCHGNPRTPSPGGIVLLAFIRYLINYATSNNWS